MSHDPDLGSPEFIAAVKAAVLEGQQARDYAVGLDKILMWEHARVSTINMGKEPSRWIRPNFKSIKEVFDSKWTRGCAYHSEAFVMAQVAKSEGGLSLLTMISPDVKVGDMRKALVKLSENLMGM